MKVITHYRNIKPDQGFESLIESAINELDSSITVESADVTVERSTSDHPPIRVRIFIETPGPDIEVQARDYTTPAALLKVKRLLQKRVVQKRGSTHASNANAPRPARPMHRK